MTRSAESNFAARLVHRLGANSGLIDAATGARLQAQEVPDLVVGFAAGFLAVGLGRVIASCSVAV